MAKVSIYLIMAWGCERLCGSFEDSSCALVQGEKLLLNCDFEKRKWKWDPLSI